MKKAEKPEGKPNEFGYVYRKPRVETIGSDDDRRDVHRFDDVVRDLLWDLMDEMGWSQTATATKCGISQSRFNAVLRGERPMGLDFLMGICAVADTDPLEVFSKHPLYADHARSLVRPKDRLSQKLQSLLRNREANRLVQILEAAKKQRRLERVLRVMAEVVGISPDAESESDAERNSSRKPAEVRRLKN